MPHPEAPATPRPNRAARRAALRTAGRVGSGALIAGAAPLALLAGTAGVAHASTITVTSTADAGPNTLRAALGSASAGDVVDLTGVSGTITLTTGAITVPAGVTITGPGASVLTIDGNDAGGIFTFSGAGAGTISGLTFTRGNRADGGAILCDHQGDADLTIANSTFDDNNATSDGGAIDWTYCGDLTITGSTFTANTATSDGGAVSFYYSTGFTMSGSTFTGNTAGDVGGGLQAEGDTDVPITVTTTTFVGNTSDDEGGGMIADGNTVVSVTQSTFRGNTAYGGGGGLYASDSASITISDVEFDDNTVTTGYGGGFSVYSGHAVTVERVNAHDNHALMGGGGFLYGTSSIGGITIADSVFDHNHATYADGGGLLLGELVDSLTTISNTTFSDNTATLYGGAIADINGDGDPGEELIIDGCTFSGNSAVLYGGAIWIEEDNVEIVNSTLSGNTADYGGALFTKASTPVKLTFVTISGNSADVGGDGVLVRRGAEIDATASIIAGNGTEDVGVLTSGAFAAGDSVLGTIAGSVTFTDNGGNVTGVTDPGLGALADNGGPTLTMLPAATSPAVDLGPASTPITTDQRGVPYVRVYGPRADAGAVEVQPDPNPGPSPEPVPEPSFTG